MHAQEFSRVQPQHESAERFLVKVRALRPDPHVVILRFEPRDGRDRNDDDPVRRAHRDPAQPAIADVGPLQATCGSHAVGGRKWMHVHISATVTRKWSRCNDPSAAGNRLRATGGSGARPGARRYDRAPALAVDILRPAAPNGDGPWRGPTKRMR